MLVLTRQIGERIIIGRDIAVVVVEIRGDKVRLGIEAPKEVPVHREEVAKIIAAHHGEDTTRRLSDEKVQRCAERICEVLMLEHLTPNGQLHVDAAEQIELSIRESFGLLAR